MEAIRRPGAAPHRNAALPLTGPARPRYSAFSLRIGGHPQFVRPLINPMAQGAAVARYGKIDEATEDKIKGLCASNENYGNFFAQNCFMGASGTLLIVSTLSEQGYPVDALQIALWSLPIALCAVIVGTAFNLLFDKKLNAQYKKAARRARNNGVDFQYGCGRDLLLCDRPDLYPDRHQGAA